MLSEQHNCPFCPLFRLKSSQGASQEQLNHNNIITYILQHIYSVSKWITKALLTLCTCARG